MKGRTLSIVIAVVATLTLIYVIVKLVSPGKTVTWFEYYRPHDKEPYDFSVVNDLTKTYFAGKKFEEHSKPLWQDLPQDSTQKWCYVFFGHSLYLGNDDFNRFMQFIRSGNEALIVSNEIPEDLFLLDYDEDLAYYFTQLGEFEDSIVTFNFTHPQLHTTSGYPFDFNFFWTRVEYRWNYFPDSLWLNASFSAVKLGNMEDNFTNFIKIPLGKGNIYLHCSPVAFTNYHLKEPGSLEYAGKVFSHLEPANIYWDNFSKVPPLNYKAEHGESPLSYILSQPSLRYAWYTLLLMAILFLLLRTKRIQNIIPVLEMKANTSLEYIKTVARLYGGQNNHKALAALKMKLFLQFIRERYGIISKNMDDDWMKLVSIKSGISVRRLKEISDEYKMIEDMESIEQVQLVELHRKIYDFQSRCR